VRPGIESPVALREASAAVFLLKSAAVPFTPLTNDKLPFMVPLQSDMVLMLSKLQ
jgi:hypothetical protein